MFGDARAGHEQNEMRIEWEEKLCENIYAILYLL